MKTIFTVYKLKAISLCMFLFCAYIISGNAQTMSVAYHRDPVVYINLMLPSADSMILVDGTAAMYANKFSASVDQYDANKLPNFLENICLLRDGKNLAIEARPIPGQNDTLFIKMWGLRQPVYAVQIFVKGIPALLGSKAWLVDNYLHTQMPLNVLSKTVYNFSPNADANSYINRFEIVFGNTNRHDDVPVSSGNIKIFPNPVSGNQINLQFSDMIKDNYKVTLSSLTGKILSSANIMHTGGNGTYYLPYNSVYTKGLYTVTISNSDDKKIIHLPVILNN